MFKEVTGVMELEQRNKIFLLDLDTLEGNWHSLLPHPLVTSGQRIWKEKRIGINRSANGGVFLSMGRTPIFIDSPLHIKYTKY